MNAKKLIPGSINEIIIALYPLTVILAIGSLFMRWVSGKLLIVGKTITGSGFPNVFWSVLIGCLAIIALYIRGIQAKNLVSRRPVFIILSTTTLIAAIYFLYGYSKTPSIPGVRVSFHGGVLFTFLGLTLAAILAIIPWRMAGETQSTRPKPLLTAEESKPAR